LGWCGVVWCGVVWCGVVWCGVVWCGASRLVVSPRLDPVVNTRLTRLVRYASFGSFAQELFRDGLSGIYLKGRDYKLTTIKVEPGAVIRADQVCWSLNSRAVERAGYEEGLHMGGNSQGSVACHLDNIPNQVQMKSHITSGDGTAWYTTQIPMLAQDNFKQGSSAIGVWVR